MDEIKRIHKRQLARFLDHLTRTKQITPGLETDVKRAFGFVFQDVESAINGQDKEIDFGKKESQK